MFNLKRSVKTRGKNGVEWEWGDEDEQKHTKKSNIDGEGTC